MATDLQLLACDSHCHCPQCSGRVAPSDPAVSTLGWAMRYAATRPGLSDFWATAVVVDTFERGLATMTPTSRALGDFLANSVKAVAPFGFLSDTRHSLAVALTGPTELNTTSLALPADWFAAPAGLPQCCPEGPPTVKAEPAQDPVDDAMPKGTRNLAGGNVMEWNVTVEAKWRKDNTGCSCDCCQFRVFVAFTIAISNPGAASLEKGPILTSSSQLGDVNHPVYHKATSNSPVARQEDDSRAAHSVEGQTFVEDVTFNAETVNPIDIAENPGAYAGEGRLKQDARPGDTVNDPDTRSADGGCRVTWTDRPRIPLKADMRTSVVLMYLAVIRARAGCAGAGTWTLYKLSGTATDIGRVPTVAEENPIDARVVKTSPV